MGYVETPATLMERAHVTFDVWWDRPTNQVITLFLSLVAFCLFTGIGLGFSASVLLGLPFTLGFPSSH